MITTTDTLTRPDTDIEEALDESIPCHGVNTTCCPNEISWRVTLACCGITFFICEQCHTRVEIGIARNDSSHDTAGCGMVMPSKDVIRRRVRI
jgi:hypothetical protein